MAEEKTSKHRPFRKFVSDEALEHARAAHKEMHKSVEALLPTGFVEHRRAARKEMLQAVRKVIDGALERIEERESE
jgi:hypothetical protein